MRSAADGRDFAGMKKTGAAKEEKSPRREIEAPKATVADFLKKWGPLLILSLILTSAFLIRVYYLYQHTEYTTDSYYFMNLARSMRSGLGYSVRGVSHIKYLPGFPLLILIFSYIFRDIARAASYLAIIGATLSILFTYLLGKELLGRPAGILGAIILAFQPTFLRWTSLPMSEGIFTFFFVAGLYLLLIGCKRASVSKRILGAFLGGLSLLTRWEGILFLPLMILIVAFYWREARFRKWEAVPILVLYCFPLGIFLVRNQAATGRLTSYLDETKGRESLSFSVLSGRFGNYAWKSLTHKVVTILFYLGALVALIKKRKAFMILFGWFLLFVLFHCYWYYVYERFMVPAIPAMALLVGYLFYQAVLLVEGTYRGQGRLGMFLRRVAGRLPAQLGRGAKAGFRLTGYLLIGALFLFTIVHGTVRANAVVRENYLAFSDDHGGRAVPLAAEWLEKRVKPGEKVAADMGPFFSYEYGGEVLYVRPVPWDLPVEDFDVRPPNLVEKLRRKGVKYLVIGHTPGGFQPKLEFPGLPQPVVAELETIGIRQEEVEDLQPLVQWKKHYEFPGPHDLYLVIFEVLD